MQYYIYKTTNTIDGKSYVGQHKVPSKPEAFMRYLGTGIAIRDAIKKYGKSAFIKEILEYIDDDDKHAMVSEREKYYIALYNTISPNGYNISPGGEGGCTGESHRKSVLTKQANGYKHSAETKSKMSRASKGKPKSDLHKQHLSEHHRLKQTHIIVFDNGNPTVYTTDSIHVIAQQYHVAARSLIRSSMRNIFINGIKLQDYYDARWELYWNLTHYGLYRNPKTNSLVPYKCIKNIFFIRHTDEFPESVWDLFETFTEDYLCKQNPPINIETLKSSELFKQTKLLQVK